MELCLYIYRNLFLKIIRGNTPKCFQLSLISYWTTKVFPKKCFYDSVVIFEKTIVSWLRYALTQCMLRLCRFISCHGSSDGRAGGYELGGPEFESPPWIL